MNPLPAGGFMRNMPQDLDQRKAWVRDRRTKSDRAEKRRKAKIRTEEIDEITDNIDRAWGSRAHHSFNPLFAGFGAGGGKAGTYVLRNGELVLK